MGVFVLAADIIQVSDSIAWVRFASAWQRFIKPSPYPVVPSLQISFERKKMGGVG